MQEERRQQSEATGLSADLINRGKQQLEAEIKVLEIWLRQLDETRKDNPESLAARKAYSDMLESRRDLLTSLQKHK